MALVLDTGPLLAFLDRREPAHDRFLEFISQFEEELVIPVPVLNELDYLISRRGSVETWLEFCEEVRAGAYSLLPVTPRLLVDAARLQAKYEDLRLGFADAAVFMTCVHLGERKVATMDRRHFSVLRTEEGGTLEILPQSM